MTACRHHAILKTLPAFAAFWLFASPSAEVVVFKDAVEVKTGALMFKQRGFEDSQEKIES